MPVDKILVTRKINFIGRDLKRLKPISLLNLKEFQKKYEYEILAERYLERIIGRMIDINYHLITGLGHLPPKDYFESFVILGQLKILPQDFTKELADLAGLRNRLAHEYNGIDEEKVCQAVKRCFSDLPKYLRLINEFVNKTTQKKLV